MALITETLLRARLARGIPNPLPIAEDDKLTPAATDFLKDRGIGWQRISAGPSFQSSDAGEECGDGLTLPVGVSARHAHLSPEHVEALFGPGYQLEPLRELTQKGQYAAKETVTLIGPKGILPNVRILGPARGVSQVEISRTDGYALGIQPPVRLSGDIRGTPGITIAGKHGAVVLREGLIVAKNHVHMSPDDAAIFNVAAGDSLIVRTTGERPVLFADVTVRISPAYTLDLHLDTDEANAASLKTGDVMRLVGRNGAWQDAARGPA